MADLEKKIDKALAGPKAKAKFSKMQLWVLRGAAQNKGWFAPRDTRGFAASARALERMGLVRVDVAGRWQQVDGVHLTSAGWEAFESLPLPSFGGHEVPLGYVIQKHVHWDFDDELDFVLKDPYGAKVGFYPTIAAAAAAAWVHHRNPPPEK